MIDDLFDTRTFEFSDILEPSQNLASYSTAQIREFLLGLCHLYQHDIEMSKDAKKILSDVFYLRWKKFAGYGYASHVSQQTNLQYLVDDLDLNQCDFGELEYWREPIKEFLDEMSKYIEM
jgi:hypothetical protein